MAEKPAAERTEQPTPRKLQKARQEGQVPQGQEMGTAVTLMVLVLSLAVLGPHMFEWFRLKVESGLIGQTDVFVDPQAFTRFFNARIVDTLLVILPVLATLTLAGICAGLAISGPTFAPKAVQFKWDAINPASVLQRGFSMRTVIRLLTSVVKLFLVSIILWSYLRDQLETMVTLRWAWVHPDHCRDCKDRPGAGHTRRPRHDRAGSGGHSLSEVAVYQRTEDDPPGSQDGTQGDRRFAGDQVASTSASNRDVHETSDTWKCPKPA